MNKLLCFDLDGTLLRDDKSIPKENIEAIQKALEAGAYISIVTGRSFASSFRIAEEIGINRKNCYLINFQGNAIYDMEEQSLIHENGLPKETVVRILKDLNEKGLYGHTYDTKGIITTKETVDLKKYNEIVGEPVHFIKKWDDLENKIYPKVISINFTTNIGLEAYRKSFIKSELSKEVGCFFSDPKYLEFTDIHSSKGNAMIYLANYLGVALKDVVAVGDERNDIPMIEMAGIGCAMANAHPDAKKVADYITVNNNDHSGVAEIIYKYILD